MFGNFLLIIAQFGPSSRIRAFANHRSNNQKSEFLLFVVVVLEVFRLGTKAPPSLIRCGAGELAEMQRRSRRSTCYGLGTALADLLDAVGWAPWPQRGVGWAPWPQRKKPPRRRDK
jgi:hypothetical protein